MFGFKKLPLFSTSPSSFISCRFRHGTSAGRKPPLTLLQPARVCCGTANKARYVILARGHGSNSNVSKIHTTTTTTTTTTNTAVRQATMSPHSLQDEFDIDRIAIIGAGPCGLAAAKYFLAEKRFSQVQVFEQRATPGGVWNYTPEHGEKQFRLPRTVPTEEPDEPIYAPGSAAPTFVSPVYDFLETNIPQTLMNYCDKPFPEGCALFPTHATVLRYLEEYAEDLSEHLVMSTQVLKVSKVGDDAGGPRCWEVETRDLRSGEVARRQFDAVLVASGHYNDPFVPDIPGLAEFVKRFPGSISHSKFYRRPDQFKDKKVIIVGNSASGIDLSAQASSVSQLPVLISEKEKAGAKVKVPSWARSVPEIAEFLPEQGRAVRFASGVVEQDVDAVVFCTGYHYSFPFLRGLEPSVVVPDGGYAAHLWEHVLYTADPTLAFASVPQRIVPFPVSQAQAAYVARVWSGRLRPPPRPEMEAWVRDLVREKGPSKAVHNLAVPRDVDYINRLRELSLGAGRKDGLENDGVGKMPPFWGPEELWVRERMPLIKLASRALGDGRLHCKSLKELGFDYEASKGGG